MVSFPATVSVISVPTNSSVLSRSPSSARAPISALVRSPPGSAVRRATTVAISWNSS